MAYACSGWCHIVIIRKGGKVHRSLELLKHPIKNLQYHLFFLRLSEWDNPKARSDDADGTAMARGLRLRLLHDLSPFLQTDKSCQATISHYYRAIIVAEAFAREKRMAKQLPCGGSFFVLGKLLPPLVFILCSEGILPYDNLELDRKGRKGVEFSPWRHSKIGCFVEDGLIWSWF